MTEIAPKAALIARTRGEVADHDDDDWDGPHALMTLHNVDGELRTGVYALIDPAMDPAAYPALIAKIAAEAMKRKDDDLPPPCAYLLQIEAYMAVIPDKADAAERRRFDEQARERKIHARPDAVEIVNAVCADVHGRLYSAVKRRDNGEITESFHAPLDRDARLTGRFADALLAAAYATGMACWALPGPIPMSN